MSSVAIERFGSVRVEGPLAESFGELHRFFFRSVEEAFHAMEDRCRGFMRAAQAQTYGVTIRRSSGEVVETTPFDVTTRIGSDDEVIFHPQVEGGIFPIVLGIGAAFAGSAIAGAAVAGTAAALLGSALFNLGVGLAISGVAELIAPSQKQGPSTDSRRENSYNLVGPENSNPNGASVPIVFGRVRTGSYVVSSSTEHELSIAATGERRRFVTNTRTQGEGGPGSTAPASGFGHGTRGTTGSRGGTSDRGGGYGRGGGGLGRDGVSPGFGR